jgi:hypothetical protein
MMSVSYLSAMILFRHLIIIVMPSSQSSTAGYSAL